MLELKNIVKEYPTGNNTLTALTLLIAESNPKEKVFMPGLLERATLRVTVSPGAAEADETVIVGISAA